MSGKKLETRVIGPGLAPDPPLKRASAEGLGGSVMTGLCGWGGAETETLSESWFLAIDAISSKHLFSLSVRNPLFYLSLCNSLFFSLYFLCFFCNWLLLGFALQKLVGFLVVSCYPEVSSGKSTEQKMDNDNFLYFLI